MKTTRNLILLSILLLAFSGWTSLNSDWISKKGKDYTLFYTKADKKNIQEYHPFFKKGILETQSFFNSPYAKKFDIYIHHNRSSLDHAWQKDWNMPDFKSECWMVASGVATKLDIISPKTWGKEACEHVYTESTKTQQLITHEMIHVFHGQLNVSPDFSNTEGLDWFIEGLATYASGQCDSARIAAVKQAIADEKIPQSLDNFWTGKLKYGLSGSVVMYIDATYGRNKLKELLPLTKKSALLSALNTTETDLLNEWKAYVKKL